MALHEGPYKVIELGVDEDVMRMYYQEAKGYKKIEAELRSRGIEVSYQSIKRFLDFVRSKMPKWIVEMDQEMAEKYANTFLRTFKLLVEQIEAIRSKLNDKEYNDWKEEAENRKIFLKLTELIAKIRGEMKIATTVINDNRVTNVQNLNVAIKNMLIQKIEESGRLDENDNIIIEDWPEAVEILKKKKLAEEG